MTLWAQKTTETMPEFRNSGDQTATAGLRGTLAASRARPEKNCAGASAATIGGRPSGAHRRPARTQRRRNCTASKTSPSLTSTIDVDLLGVWGGGGRAIRSRIRRSKWRSLLQFVLGLVGGYQHHSMRASISHGDVVVRKACEYAMSGTLV